MSSQAERNAGSVLTPLGFIYVHGARMPYEFVDKENAPFSAMADFFRKRSINSRLVG